MYFDSKQCEILMIITILIKIIIIELVEVNMWCTIPLAFILSDMLLTKPLKKSESNKVDY